jgi:hypothetical protein
MGHEFAGQKANLPQKMQAPIPRVIIPAKENPNFTNRLAKSGKFAPAFPFILGVVSASGRWEIFSRTAII